MREITYYVKTVYGVDRMYISDPVTAEAIRVLTSAVTVDWRHVHALEALGFKLTQVLPPSSRPVSPVNR